MKKVRSIHVREGFDYGLPQSSPPRNGQIIINSVFGGYDQHYVEEGEQSANAGQADSQEYIEEINSTLLDINPKVEADDKDNKHEAQ